MLPQSWEGAPNLNHLPANSSFTKLESRHPVSESNNLMRHRERFVVFIAAIQAILLLAHYFLYETWMFRHIVAVPAETVGRTHHWIACHQLCCGFPARLLLHQRSSCARFIRPPPYGWDFSASFFWPLSCRGLFSPWPAWQALFLNFHLLVQILFGVAAVVGFYGLFNAHWTRITRIKVELENLPGTWRGRKAALVSDVHLGHVRNGNFLRRLIGKILQEEPDAIFIAGDLYDGTAIDAARAAAPLSQLTAPHGVYFVAGNHEQFGDDTKYLKAIAAAGVRVLHNETVEVDGLQIVGVPYRNATQNGSLDRILRSLHLDHRRASILLTHAPDYPEVAEAAGVSLQLSGHTHLGQFIPWSWMARRMYRQFVYGLSRIGKMQVFTSSGAGTWGPPLRLGSNPEIVMLEFV